MLARASAWSGLALAALVLLWLGSMTDIDLALADAAYDRLLGAFPWRHAWLAERFSHVLLKRLLVGLGLLFIAAVLWDLARPQAWTALRRGQLRVVALSALLVPGTVALLKRLSSSHCPWDLERYGGMAPYVRLLEALPAGVDPGHCMPGGHASGALWLVSLSVLLLPKRPVWAGAAAVLLLAGGLAVGWLQQLRGAHFLTHTLWSAWIACAIILGVFTLVTRR
jgi:membrane-associated PAP2 superfamily phosphatase